MARHVYVIAWDVATMMYDYKTLSKQGETDTAVFIAQRQTTMDEVVKEIVKMAKPDGMKILRISGHGAPGIVKLGRDSLFDITVDKFKALNGLFVKAGRIELHSCQAGADANTVARYSAGWLTKLATNTGVAVMAAKKIQHVDRNWDWEGDVYTFYPLEGDYSVDTPDYERTSRADRQ